MVVRVETLAGARSETNYYAGADALRALGRFLDAVSRSLENLD